MSAILKKFQLQFLYIMMWVVLAIFHLFVLNWGYNIRFSSALADSMVFNFMFAILGVGLWFSVKFAQLQKKNVFEILFQHLTTSTILLLLWMLISKALLGVMLKSDVFYIEFLDRSITMRIFSGILFYGLLVSIYYLIASFRELNEKAKKEALLTTMLKEAELDMLRSQIRPHFLFNSLNAISSLTISRPEQAQEMVIKLSEFMRYSLSQQGEMMSTLEKELYHIKLYLDIEQVRFSGKLKISHEVDENVLAWKVPSMLLQPLVENAIKYGVYGSEGQSNISLKAFAESNHLQISICNNFDPDDTPRKGTGTGLRNVARRLETIYSQTGLMQVKNNGSDFEVLLKIPSHANN
ncbi:MAG: histidine kinase [Bacteroidales bacterium]|nr:histidine kinase [Bacteroidales bacterium]